MANILVTCVGSGVGQSVIDSLNLSGKHTIIGCDTNRNVYAYQFCNYFHIVPSIYSDGYVDFLLNLCIKKSIDLIVPGHDHELLLLSENLVKFEEKGINIIVSRPDIIEVSRDKYHWFTYFNKYGCSIVPTFKVTNFKKKPDTSIFPAIIKPSGGSASQGIHILNDISELYKANDNDIIQPYLFPKNDDPNYDTIKKVVGQGRFVQMSEISIQLIFTKNSDFAGIFISKNSLKNGVPIFVDPITPSEFEYIDEIMKFVPIFKEKKVKGPVNIQGRITEKGLVFFEMNMRFTGITGNRAQLGFNEVEFLVDNFLGLPGELNGYAKNKFGVRQVACTTIPKLSTSISKRIFTIFGTAGNLELSFIQELIKLDNYHKINVISNGKYYDSYLDKFNNKKVEIFKDTYHHLESIYCQSDVLINFINASALKSESEKNFAIMFQYEQIQKIIKSNVPFIINVSPQPEKNHSTDAETISNSETFLLNITEMFFESVRYFSPISKYFSLRIPNKLDDQTKDEEITIFLNKVFDSIKTT
jgi:hypothetical protein